MIRFSSFFLKDLKQLKKRYKKIDVDLKDAIKEIENDDLGTSLGFNVFKKRVKNSSVPTGKSGGFRIIIFQKIQSDITLMTIYSKTEKDSISDSDIKEILREIKE